MTNLLASSGAAQTPRCNGRRADDTRARELVRKDGSRPVPEHLRNAPTRLMQQEARIKERLDELRRLDKESKKDS